MSDIPLTKVNNNLKISYSDAGVQSTSLKTKNLTFIELSEAFKEPKIGLKDGTYFIRGSADKRNDSSLKHADLIIIDADSTINLKTNDVTDGAPEPNIVHKFLESLGLTHCIYSSYSNIEKGYRYRVIIPVQLKNKEELKICLDYLFDEIHSEGIQLNNCRENYTWAQPWYFPRVPEQYKSEYKFYVYNSGNTLDAVKITESILAQNQHESKSISTVKTKKTQIEPVPLTELQSLLKSIPSDDYHDWTTIGMAIHHETNGSDEGLILWNQWSEQSSKYSSKDELIYKWRSFNRSSTSKNVGMGTIKFISERYSIKSNNEELANHLDYSNKNVKSSISNAVKIIGFDTNLPDINFDEFLQKETIDSEPLQDKQILKIKLYISDTFKAEYATKNIHEAVQLVAENNPVNCVTDYFELVNWDREDRLDNLLIDHAHAANSKFTKAVTAITMISAVARACEPGCKVDSMLILEGSQGCGKSTLIKVLSPLSKLFSDTPLKIGDKDSYLQLQGKLFYEISEMSSILKANTNETKAFLSASVDTFRVPYAQNTIDYPRRNIFIGTTNDQDYLNDATGGRRYLPISVGTVDIDSVELIKDQIWAEAYYRYRNGEQWHLTSEMEEIAKQEQDKRFNSDPWENEISEWLSKNNITKVTSNMIYSELFDIEISKISRPMQTRVAGVMARLGFERKTLTIGGEKVKGYEKV